MSDISAKIYPRDENHKEDALVIRLGPASLRYLGWGTDDIIAVDLDRSDTKRSPTLRLYKVGHQPTPKAVK